MRIVLAFLLLATVVGMAMFLTFTSSWGVIWATQTQTEPTALVEETPPTPTPDWAGKIVVDITQSVVLRSAPAPSADTVGVLRRGDKVALAGCDAEVLWCQTEDGAWMLAYMVENIPNEAPILDSPELTVGEARVMPTPTEEAPPTPTLEPMPTVSLALLLPTATPTPVTVEVAVVDAANLRAGPGATFARIGSVAAGATIQLSGQIADGSWYRLTDGSWIAAFLVESPTVELPIVEANVAE